jgi:hypothetical protein
MYQTPRAALQAAHATPLGGRIAVLYGPPRSEFALRWDDVDSEAVR